MINHKEEKHERLCHKLTYESDCNFQRYSKEKIQKILMSQNINS